LVVSYDIDKTMVQSSSVIQGMSFAARNTNFNVLFASSLLFFEIVSI